MLQLINALRDRHTPTFQTKKPGMPQPVDGVSVLKIYRKDHKDFP